MKRIPAHSASFQFASFVGLSFFSLVRVFRGPHPHRAFVIRHSSFVIRHSSFVIRHSSFVIRHSSFVIPHSPSPPSSASLACPSPMQTALKVRLSIFMFLQYFIWGSWYVSMGAYLANVLKFGGQEIGASCGAFAIGSMISPFFVGLIADRYFASEKMLAVLGIVGGVVLCLLPQVTTFATFYPLLIGY